MATGQIRITDKIALFPITVQPGETVKNFPLNVADLMAATETVTAVLSDNLVTVPVSSGSGRTASITLIGPANGVQVPVRLTVMGSLGSMRHLALNIIGLDPFTRLVPSAPNIYLRWRGGWQLAGIYLPYDLVLYGGIIYLALNGSSASAPDLNVTDWMAWAGTGGGGGGGGMVLSPDAGGTGRSAAFKTTWVGPGIDDWKVEVVGVI
jgi:hypothetical protein